MDIAIPCRCEFPLRNDEEALFAPGILIHSEAEDQLGRVALAESSRYNETGFWSRLQCLFYKPAYSRKCFDLVMETASVPVWTLQGRATTWNPTTSNQVFNRAGSPAGRVEVTSAAFKMARDTRRATFRDEQGTAVGHYEQTIGLTSARFRFVDERRGWEYALDFDSKTGQWGYVRASETAVIDSRLLLAWLYFSKFHDEPD